LLLSFLTWRQLPYWQDGPTVFGRGLRYNAGDPSYGGQYVDELLFAGDLPRARAALERVLPYALDRAEGDGIQRSHLALLERAGDRDGAVAAAREYLRRDPGFWKTRLRLADLLLAGNRFGEAAAEFGPLAGATLPATPFERSHILEGLGICLAEMGNGEEAERAYLEGLRIFPGSPSLRHNLALLRASRGDRAEEVRKHDGGAP
jgi:tetratricopeptide (TPR) repeat protein